MKSFRKTSILLALCLATALSSGCENKAKSETSTTESLITTAIDTPETSVIKASEETTSSKVTSETGSTSTNNDTVRDRSVMEGLVFGDSKEYVLENFSKQPVYNDIGFENALVYEISKKDFSDTSLVLYFTQDELLYEALYSYEYRTIISTSDGNAKLYYENFCLIREELDRKYKQTDYFEKWKNDKTIDDYEDFAQAYIDGSVSCEVDYDGGDYFVVLQLRYDNEDINKYKLLKYYYCKEY